MLLRHLIHVVLASALAAGCSQSLFGDGTGGSDDSPLDADPGQPDAGVDTPDADLTNPDGGIPPDAMDDCTVICVVDDAVEDFNGSQGGMSRRWGYVEYQPDADSYAEMASADLTGLQGFQGTGTPTPSIAYCPEAVPDTVCADLAGALALTTTAPGAHHPALRWTVPQSGLYTLSINFDISPAAPAVPIVMLLTHNSQSNVLESETSNGTPGAISGEYPLAAGDIVVLSAVAETDTVVSVGVNFVITGRPL